MWPFDSALASPAGPYFEEMKRRAANIPAPGETGTYTLAMFTEYFPEFFAKSVDETTGEAVYTPVLPQAMIERMIDTANRTILPSVWGPSWEEAAGLYVAHLAALRMQTYSDGAQPGAAANMANVGVVKSATMGDTSLTYDNTALNAATEHWGTWNATRYGSQLATMARMIGIAGMYVI